MYVYCSYAESVGAVHYTASAKQNKGVQELFLDLSKSKFASVFWVRFSEFITSVLVAHYYAGIVQVYSTVFCVNPSIYVSDVNTVNNLGEIDPLLCVHYLDWNVSFTCCRLLHSNHESVVTLPM